MFKCELCNKEYKYKSDFEKHKNRKTPCVKSISLECEHCKVKFKCKAEKLRHEKTIKHVTNITNITNNNTTNNNINNFYNHITNNIIQILCPVNTFTRTGIDHLENGQISYLLGYKKDIIERLEFDNEENKTNPYYSLYFMKAILNIFKDLNFSLEKPSNNNCKIIFFTNDKLGPDYNKMMCYLILEINNDGKLVWQNIDYYQFLDLLIELMHIIKNKFENEKLVTALEYLDKYFINNIKMKDMCKAAIESELDNISDTVKATPNTDYKESIKKLTKLWDGQQPDIEFD